MTAYIIHYAEDVTAFGVVQIEADSDGEAIARAIAFEWDGIAIDPQYDSAHNRRIVSLYLPEGGVIAEDIPLDLEDDPPPPAVAATAILCEALKKARDELQFQQRHFPRADDTELREVLHLLDTVISGEEGGSQ